ncbi:MAG: alpha/beta hydrolase [Planctomycetaceae bacterium]|nr:alpha/beta hydrolase [Planctomycetaceae bacterium]
MSLTLLLLPGLHGGAKLLDRFVAALPDWIDPRIITYPNDRAISYDDILDGLVLPDKPFAVLAESYAGPLGIRIAAAQLPHLRALVLVATFARCPHPYFPPWTAALVRHWMFRIPMPLRQNLVRRLFLRDNGPPAELDEGWRELFLCDPEVLAARVREVVRVDVRNLIPDITAPTLYVQASPDVVVPARSMHEIQNSLRHMEVARFESAHPVLQRRPTKTAIAVAAFLERAMSAKPQA